MLCFVEGVDDDEQTASSFLRSSSQCWLFDGRKRLEEQFINEPLDTNGVASPDARSDRLEPLLEDSTERGKGLSDLVGEGLDHESRVPFFGIVVAAQVHCQDLIPLHRDEPCNDGRLAEARAR